MMKYTAEISGYYFSMENDSLIEIRENLEDELSMACIRVNPGSVKTEKDFHYEIMDWYTKYAE